jgi:hypothetical protein
LITLLALTFEVFVLAALAMAALLFAATCSIFGSA